MQLLMAQRLPMYSTPPPPNIRHGTEGVFKLLR
jgi:hypothetical protein